MKIFLILSSILLSGSHLIAQKKDILYYLPDSVEIKIGDYLLKQKSSFKFYCVISSSGKDTFDVSICHYTKDDKRYVERWVFMSKRKVVIDNVRYPLLLDYDYRFGAENDSEIGVYGDRTNKLVRLLPIFHCFKITFTKYFILDNSNKPIGYANKQHKLD